MSRNQNNLYKNLKLKFSKSLSKSKYESINTSECLMHTNNNSGINMQKNETEINNNRVNTMESIHKPFISLLKVDALTNSKNIKKNHNKSKNFHIQNLTNLFKSYSKNKKRNLRNQDLSINLTINNSLQQNFKNKNLTTVINKNNHSRINSNSPNKNNKKNDLINKKISHIRTNINSPLNRSEILQSELEDKEKKMNNLKEILINKEKIINDLKNEIQILKNNKNEEDEYEQYSKKIMIRNIKLLTVENNDLRKELEIYKNKEIKIMSILYNLNKNGIPIDDLVNFAQESNLNSQINLNNNEKSDNITSSNTFIPIYIKSNSNINNFYDIKNDMNIPNLNFDNLNQKYNEEFIQNKNNNNNNNNNYNNNNYNNYNNNNNNINNNFIDIGNIKINFNDNQNFVNSPITSSINNSISTTANGYSYNNNLKKENKEKTKNNINNNNNKNKNSYSNKNYIYNSQEIKSNNYYYNKNNNNNNKNNNNNNNKEKNFTNFNVNCNINPKHHNNFSLNQKFKMSKLLEKFK